MKLISACEAHEVTLIQTETSH